ncbi:MAG: NADH-quinone oxidoreductase subunit NuoK [Coriobacteriales bacterium]|nr:NADH-quinone oxidoreductase subunit NuoK [Coriobacteriales bacterium]
MSLIVVASILFGIGLFGVMVRRDIIAVLIAVEIMMGAALVLLVALGSGTAALGDVARISRAQSVGLLVLVAAAAEAAVGLALLVAIARRWQSTRIDEMTEGRG